MGRPAQPGGLNARSVEIDTSVPHAARVYDYMLGGVTNFEVDRVAAEQAAAVAGGMDRIRAEVRANRAFLRRAVRFLIHEAGIRRFLDIGTGIPNADNVHAVAQQEAPDARVVYVDKDPVVLAHAHVLLAGAPDGATHFVHDDFRQPERILERATAVLDPDGPWGVMMVGFLHHFRDDERPDELVTRLMDGVPPGSYLVVSHLASDIDEQYTDAGAELDEAMDEPLVFRPYGRVAEFVAGLDMVEPGLVPVDRWRPDGAGPEPGATLNPLYAGVGLKRGAPGS